MNIPCNHSIELTEFERAEVRYGEELREINRQIDALMRNPEYSPATPENFAEAMSETFAGDVAEPFSAELLGLMEKHPGPVADYLKALARTYWEEQTLAVVEASIERK